MSLRDAEAALPPDSYRSIFLSPEWQHVRYLGWQTVPSASEQVRIIQRRYGPLTRRLVLSETARVAEIESALADDGAMLRETIVHDFAASDMLRDYLVERGYTALRSAERLLNIATFVVDLRQEEERLHGALSGHARRMIRRGDAEGLTFEEPGEAGLMGFQDAHDALAFGKGLRRLDPALLRKMLRSAGARLFAVRQGTTLAAFAIIYLADRRALYLHGAATSKSDGIGYFLQWHCICTLKRDGFFWYDMGGVPTLDRTNGIHLFKRQFGGQLVELGTEYRKGGLLVRLARSARGLVR